MSTATTIARRELSSLFFSPIAYVAMALFLIINGFLFREDFQPGAPAEMRSVFETMVWVLVFIIPVLCMGLISQEFSSGTVETLMTAPVSEYQVILGKFLGSLSFYLVLLAPTLLYLVMLELYAEPDLRPALQGYLGLVLVGALFIAVSLFCSSLTRSQVIAAVTAAAILFLVTIVPWWATSKVALPDFWRAVAAQGVFNRYNAFSKGIFDSGNLVYFLAGTGVFLFLTVKVLESRRWR